MNLKNLSIGTQLKIGFATMLLFVIILGALSYQQSDKIHQQTETMYNHPVLVRRAIGLLHSGLLDIRLSMKDLFLDSEEKEIAQSLNRIETQKANALAQIDQIYTSYLGPPADVDSLKQAFILYNSVREETVRLFRAGKIQEAASRTKNIGIGGKQSEKVLAALQKIDDFARFKGDTLYANSIKLKNTLHSQLLLLIAVLLVLSFFINFLLLRSIRKPLTELTNATQHFHIGDMEARCAYKSQNEIGALSASFNTLAEGIQATISLNEKVVSLSRMLLSKYEVKEFFQEAINALSIHTGSQLAAVYLLSDDKKTFEHFESIGVDDNARQSFAADRFEGEFGAVLTQSKIQHIKNIPADTRFVFHTVSGKFIPNEIITIPILTNNEVVAIISLSSVSPFTNQAIQLIDSIFVTLSARVEGIIAYHKMRKFSEKLEFQNRELEAQKTEMASQSAEVTEQNMELEMQKKQLSEANQLKTNFLSNMSHELRTPLNSVIALSGVLNRRLAKQIPAEEYSYLEIIERNGKNLLFLINDILDISRIEAGREEIEISRFDVNDLISEIITNMKVQAKQKNIELIQTEINPDLYLSNAALYLSSDMVKCRHILQNLVSNAVKFTEHGKIEVKAREINTKIEITVSDTGIGISESNLPHIFDEFRQADSSTSRRFGGSGLGLAIAKKYASLLGGTITVKSVFGEGSEFTLILPMQTNGESHLTEVKTKAVHHFTVRQANAETVSVSQNKTVLLVEDSEPAIIQLKDILEESGYKILVARDGAEALGIIAQTIPDAMILDLMMPGVDGFEVLGTLRGAEQTAHIPVLILTAKHITKEELKFLTRNNIHQLIQKGDVNRIELLGAVVAMVEPRMPESPQPKREIHPIEGNPLVLVVEDNPDNMTTVKALLDGNYTILEATNGNEAVKMADMHKPDLILMDIALPEMDGIEAYRAIRNKAHLQHTAIIALTASAMTSDREAILAHGFDAYIAKPIDQKSFFITINEVLYGK
ncbi:MAG: response regulator [Bacteroidales bacterium]|nr:response regulator [Bacteroidales bacterium]